jgi:hypothetical protein
VKSILEEMADDILIDVKWDLEKLKDEEKI